MYEIKYTKIQSEMALYLPEDKLNDFHSIIDSIIWKVRLKSSSKQFVNFLILSLIIFYLLSLLASNNFKFRFFIFGFIFAISNSLSSLFISKSSYKITSNAWRSLLEKEEIFQKLNDKFKMMNQEELLDVKIYGYLYKKGYIKKKYSEFYLEQVDENENKVDLNRFGIGPVKYDLEELFHIIEYHSNYYERVELNKMKNDLPIRHKLYRHMMFILFAYALLLGVIMVFSYFNDIQFPNSTRTYYPVFVLFNVLVFGGLFGNSYFYEKNYFGNQIGIFSKLTGLSIDISQSYDSYFEGVGKWLDKRISSLI